MAIAFKGVTSGKREDITLTVNGTSIYTFKTKYKEQVESTRVTSEKWNGTTYQRIHRVIRTWKKIEFNTGKIKGTRAEAEAFVLELVKSEDIVLDIGSTSYKVTLENSDLYISDSVQEKGYSLNLMFKTSEEV